MGLSERSRDFLFMLTHQLRCILLPQAMAWGGWRHQRSASKFLVNLEQAGLVTRRRALLRPQPPVTKPLWITGQSQSSFYRIAYEVQARFHNPPRLQTLWLATPKAVNLVGGTTAKLLLAQAVHDCHMTAVYLAKLQSEPELVTDWLGEDIYAKHVGKGKLPDALLVRDGQPYLAIESAGCSYNACRIRAFIEYCNQQQLACEVW